MPWSLGNDSQQAASTTLTADRNGLAHSPITVSIDDFDPIKHHVTVVVGHECVVSDLAETSTADCAITITSPHAELLVILPIPLATLLTSIEAAHRESIEDNAANIAPEHNDMTEAQLAGSWSHRVMQPLRVVRDAEQ